MLICLYGSCLFLPVLLCVSQKLDFYFFKTTDLYRNSHYYVHVWGLQFNSWLNNGVIRPGDTWKKKKQLKLLHEAKSKPCIKIITILPCYPWRSLSRIDTFGLQAFLPFLFKRIEFIKLQACPLTSLVFWKQSQQLYYSWKSLSLFITVYVPLGEYIPLNANF